MDDTELQTKLAARFKELPSKVQAAITSASIQEHLKQLADTHKLHLDQWSALENEVMLTLLGFSKADDLVKNIQREVGLDEATAAQIAADISGSVFAPIRAELQRLAPEGSVTPTAPAPAAPPSAAAAPIAPPPPAPPAVAPATPPAPKPEQKVERAPLSGSYAAAAAPSHERKEIAGDPYREQI